MKLTLFYVAFALPVLALGASSSPKQELPGCQIPPVSYTCVQYSYNDPGCSITCPADMYPVCKQAQCVNDYDPGPSSCSCQKETQPQ